MIFEVSKVAVLRLKFGNADKISMFSQLAKIVGQAIEKGKIRVVDLIEDTDAGRNVALMFNMMAVADDVVNAVEDDSLEKIEVVFGQGGITRSTLDCREWWTKKDFVHAKKSHVNPVPYDSKQEKKVIQILEKDKRVKSWGRADKLWRLGMSIKYTDSGRVREYRPDFMVRIRDPKSGMVVNLLLEFKGKDSRNVGAKKKALRDWVDAVNHDGRFGTWAEDIAWNPAEVSRIIRSVLKKQSDHWN